MKMLRDLSLLLLLALPGFLSAQVSFTGSPYVQDFNSLAGTTNNTANVTWTNNSTLPGWYASKSGYHVTDGTMGGAASNFDSTGTANNIGLISFGSAGGTDRALGSRATSTSSLGTTNAPVQYGLRLVNDTAQTITSFSVMFTGEQWFASTQSAAHTLQVDYSIGATSLTSGTYVSNFTSFTAPVSTGTTARALDGNASANRRGVARLVTGVSWAPGQELWIRITDTNESGNEQGLAVDDFIFTSEGNSALFFNGATNHVTMGAATSTLGASVFTLEAWIFRTGTGTTTSTGTGGVTAYPIVAKGRGESETAGLNCNYFLGINAANKLVADFEAAAASGITTGQNYPVTGASTIPFNQWVHVAATYDGGATDGEKWKLFVNGVKDTTSATTGVNPPANAAPEAISTQHFAIGTAMNSSGTREGTFLGLIDEVRVWNVARSEAQIAGDKGVELTSGSGLLARYGLGEGTGATAASSVAGAPNGTLSGSPVWMHGNSFVTNIAPTAALTSPAAGASFDAPASISLAATAEDSDGSIAKVEFYSGAAKIGEDATAPYEFVWENVISGGYSLTARAVDNLGETGNSSAVNVTVTNVDNDAPAASLTAPIGGGTLFTGNITITANASDSDGVVSRVEFFNGTTKLGEDTASPYAFTWAGVAPGSYSLTVVATDNDGATTASGAVNMTVVTPITATLLAKGATWKYLDNGSDQGTAWKEGAFDDSAWASGPAKLGYEDGAVTTLRQGPDGMTSTTKYITYYFRRTFNVSAAGAVQQLNLNILRDDGVVVYINGAEVARQNMPADAVNHLTNSAATVSGTDETTYFTSTASPVLNEGENVIAVELHQRDNASSDLGFDMEVVALSVPGDPPAVSLTAPANGAVFSAPATISLTADAADSDGAVTKVEFFNGTTKLGEDTTAPYAFAWTGVAQGGYTLTARATDSQGQTMVSDVVSITVGPPMTEPPSVSISVPADGATFLAPATVTIAANAADSDGTVTRVEFFNGATKLGEDTTAPFELVWSNVAIGTYSLTAKATDDMTAATTSAAVTVNVVVNQAPAVVLASPADLAANVGGAGAVTLSANVSDPEGQPLTVTFYGRLKSPPAGPDFTLVTLPDTQFYSENTGGNRLQHFTSQTNWIVANRETLNIPFVAHMGDMVQNGDSVPQEWINADGAMAIIENPVTTLLTHGIPWGGAPGNHDQQPIGSPDGASAYWNTYFGTSRWAGRPYWGGNYSTNNDNNYQLFSASGLDFIIINMEYRPSANQAVLDWADALLKAYPNRRAIVTSHWLINTGNPATWGGHGQAVYDNLKDNPNLFLMLCGHIHGEGQRADTFEGRTVYTVLQDYQSRANGGDSWLRYFVFSPANNTITAKTLQTRTLTFETDADSEFTLPYTMGAGSAAWTALGTVNASGGSATLDWTGLEGSTEYEWYAAVSDGTNSVGSEARGFTTAANSVPTVSLTSPAEGATIALPAQVLLEAAAADSDGSVVKVEFYAGETKVGEDSTAPFSFAWTAVSGTYALSAVATDNQGAGTGSAIVNITVTNPGNLPPSVALSSPAAGSTQASGSISLTATAADSDGLVTRVEFFNGVTKLGEDSTTPYQLDWTGVAAGNYTLTAVATDNDGGMTASSPVSISVRTPVSSTLIARRPSGQPGAVWKYLDNGSDQGTAWRGAAFDDSAWSSGAAPLGYGDSHIATTVNSGPSGSRIITTYLRRSFTLNDASLVRALNLSILRDDGVVVYINGAEVARQNMPDGAVTYQTFSASTVDGANETTYFASAIPALPALVDGENIIAVEVHNRDGSSSDLGFDLELTAQSIPSDPLALTKAASGILPAAAILNGTVNPRGQTVSAWFEYGATAAYGQTVPVTLAPADGGSDQSVSAAVSPLLPDMLYHYRLVVQAAEVTVYGEDKTFTTTSRRIAVSGNGVEIGNEDDKPSELDHTDFGPRLLGSAAVSRSFTISNSGTADVVLSGTPRVSLSGGSAFSITRQPSSATVTANGGTLDFEVTFDPSVEGLHEAMVSIDSNDDQASPYNFALKGLVTTGGAFSLGSAVLTQVNGDSGATLTVSRDGTAAASVTLVTSDGTASVVPPFAAALAGVDYTAVSTVVSFAEGELSRSVSIPLLPRPASAPNRRFSVSLTSPAGGSTLGAITSAEVRILAADTLKPTLTVSSPSASAAALSAVSPFQVKGTAGDARGIDRVELVLNGGPAVNAVLGSAKVSTSVPWSLDIEPLAGANTLAVTAYDLRGNASATVTRSFTFARRHVLSVTGSAPSALSQAGGVTLAATPTTAASALTPSTAGASPRTSSILPGTAVRLTAMAKTGFWFSHWAVQPAGAVALGGVLSFTMPAQDVAAEAVFVANPLLDASGRGNVYYGLLNPFEGVAAGHGSVGFLTGTVTPATGGFSGKVMIGGTTTAVAGAFQGDGRFLYTVGSARSWEGPLAGGRRLELVLEGTDIRVNLRNAGDGAKEVTGQALRAFYGTGRRLPVELLNRKMPATAAAVNQGFLTVALPAKAQVPARDPGSYPQGTGFGTVSWKDAGEVTFAGTLADGGTFTGSSGFVTSVQWPYFAALATPGAAASAAKGGSISGELEVDTAQAGSDVTGSSLLWIRPEVVEQAGTTVAAKATQLYTAGWPEGIRVDAVGAFYDEAVDVATALGLGPVNAATGNGEMMFKGGKLVNEVLVRALNIAAGTTAGTSVVTKIPATNSSFTLVVNQKLGTWSGTFTPDWTQPAAAKPAFKGALLQKGEGRGGYGWFISNRSADPDPESGEATLGAQTP